MSQYLGQAPSFSVLDVLRGMARRKLLMFSCLALGILAGFALVTLIKPIFLAEARVLIDNLSTPYDQANVTQEQREVAIDDRVVASQVAVLQSEDIAKRVSENLNLGAKPEFDPMQKGLGLLKKLFIICGFSDDPRLMTVEQRAVSHLSDKLTVYSLPDSNVIGIKYTASDGQTAADVANALAQTYVLSTREAKSGSTGRARAWLSEQIELLRGKVTQSDAAVEKYRAENGLFKGETVTLGAQEISELNTQITLAEAASSEAKAKAEEIQNMLETRGSVEGSSEVLNSPTIQRLREQQLSVTRKMSELSATYLPNHPKMLSAQKEANDVEKQLRREALKIVDGLQGQAKIAAARATSLRDSLEEMKTREGGSLQDEVKLKELEREAKANRDQLETMLARYADTNTRQNLDLQPGFGRIIQNASAPAMAYFPRVGPIMVLTSLAGLGLGLGLAFLLEIMAQAARLNQSAVLQAQAGSRSSHAARSMNARQMTIPALDVEQEDDEDAELMHAIARATAPQAKASNPPAMGLLMSLANVPMARSASEARALLGSFADSGETAQSVAQIADQMQSMFEKGKLKACAIAGIGGSLEVATSALALGRALAKAGRKTILIDLEGQRALIPDLMDLPFAPGLAELVSGQSDFTKAIQRDTASPLQIIRHGNFDPRVQELLASRMAAVTNTLAGIYDVVLLHVGEASPATLAIVRGCTSALLYAPQARQKDAVAAATTLQSRGVNNVYLVRVDGPLLVAA